MLLYTEKSHFKGNIVSLNTLAKVYNAPNNGPKKKKAKNKGNNDIKKIYDAKNMRQIGAKNKIDSKSEPRSTA